MNRSIGLLALAPVASLAALAALATIGWLWVFSPSAREAWLLGAILWASLAAFPAIVVVAGLVSRIAMPASQGLLKALSTVLGGNLALGALALPLGRLSSLGILPWVVEETIVLTFMTAALLFSAVTFTRRTSPSGGIALVATALAVVNAALGSVLAAFFVLSVLFPPIT